MAERHAYRIEISGGFSGSAYRYHSMLTGTLEGACEYILSIADEPEDAMMLVTEGFTAVLEYHEDSRLHTRVSFLPALSMRAGDHTVSFADDDAVVLDGQRLDDDGLQDRLDEIIDAFLESVEADLDVSALRLPEASGQPWPDDEPYEVTNLAGVTHPQRCGELVGDFGEAYEYRGA